MSGVRNMLLKGRDWTNLRVKIMVKRIWGRISALMLIMLIAPSSTFMQPLVGAGSYYVTYRSGEDVVLAPNSGSEAGGGGTDLTYSLMQIPQKDGWGESFDSPPQGVPVAQWASANGYQFEGNAPSSAAMWLNVTGGRLEWHNFYTTRTKQAYNCTLTKELDPEGEGEGGWLSAYNLTMVLSFSRTWWHSGSPPLYLTITALDANMVPVLVMRFNHTNALNGNATAYGGSPVPLSPVGSGKTFAFSLVTIGYGQQAALYQNGTQKLAFIAYTPVKYIAVSFFINEPAYANYDREYSVRINEIGAAPLQELGQAAAVVGLPCGEWAWVWSSGATDAPFQVQNGGGISIAAPVFNGEFSEGTTGAWVNLDSKLTAFSVSDGKLRTATHSRGGLGGVGLMANAQGFTGAYYRLPTLHEGDFYVATYVDVASGPAGRNYIGLAVTDGLGRVVAYIDVLYAYISSTMELRRYYGVYPGAVTYSKLVGAWCTAIDFNISRVGTTWYLRSTQLGIDCQFEGTDSEIGGILLNQAFDYYQSIDLAWDYVRTNLPVENISGALCASLDLRSVKAGTFHPNTTLTFTRTSSGITLLEASSSESAGGMIIRGLADGDGVTIFYSNGSVAYNTTVPSGSTGITISPAQVPQPFTGTVVVTERAYTRALASFIGNLTAGDSLTFERAQDTYVFNKTTGGEWDGVVVSGLQLGWRVLVTNGTVNATYWAGSSGETMIYPIPCGACTINVLPPTARIPASLQPGGNYALERIMHINHYGACTDTAFFEVDTSSYTYRVEAKVLSTELYEIAPTGIKIRIIFEFRSYENGLPSRCMPPKLYSGGIQLPIEQLSQNQYEALVVGPEEGDWIQLQIVDPSSGIVLKGRLVI